MDTAIKKRLLLAKEFHLNACELAKKTDQLSRMMAVHNFHIGIEIILKAILLKYEIRAENALGISFDGLMADVDNHQEFRDKNKKLPYRQQISGLNRMRGLVQHHAKVPDPSDLEDYRLYTEKFLISVFREYFDTDFATVNRISFVEDTNLQKLLNRASEELAQAKFFASVCFSAATFEYARTSVAKAMQDMYTLSKSSSAIGRSKANFRGELKQAFEYALNKVAESERLAILLTSGITISNFRQFKQLTPHIQFMSAGNPRFQVSSNYDLNSDNANWVLEFVISSIINWQQIGLKPELDKNRIRGVENFLRNGV
jgi:hypothetical protein